MKLYVDVLLVFLLFLISACGGGGGSSSDSGGATSGTATPTIDRNLGLVSGGAGLVSGSGVVDSVNLVGVSGSGVFVGVSGSGVSAGTIQDFGSIIINDERLETTNAAITINGSDGVETDLRQGQQVLVIGDVEAGSATSISYTANIIAYLDELTVEDVELGLATGQSLSQRIEFDASTVYENTEFELLTVGTPYEISGILEDDGLLLVTFIRPVAEPLAEFQLIGEVTDLTASSFSINNLVVDFTSAVIEDFEENRIEADDVVAVTLDPATFVANSGEATRVRLLPRLLLSDMADVEVEGLIDQFSSTNDFDVQNQPVTITSQTQFINGDIDDLAVDERVLIVGDINGGGVLVAEEVFFESDDSVFVAGFLDSIDLSEEVLTVLGIAFDVRDLTDLDDFDGLEDLQIGDPIEIVGYVDGANPVAAEVELETAIDEFLLRGPAENIVEAAGTFEIFGVAIGSDPAITEFSGFADEDLTQAEFFQLLEDYDFVEVEWEEGQPITTIPNSLSLEDD